MAEGYFDDVSYGSSDEEDENDEAPDDAQDDADDANPFEDPENDDGEEENEELTPEMMKENALGVVFWFSCSNGLLEPAKAALKQGANPLWRNYECNGISGDNMLPLFGLFIAAQNGHIDIVRWLTTPDEMGNVICPADTYNEENESTALHFAAMNDHVEIMKLLLESNNPPEIDQGTEGTALHFAALRGRLAAAKFLLENGADVEAVDEIGQTPIFGAAYQGKTDMCRFLVQNGAKVNVQEESGDTPLFNAAFAGTLATVKFFVEETDVNLEYRKKDGRSAFDHANEHSMSEAALYLWKHGCGAPVRRPSKLVANLQRLYCVDPPFEKCNTADVFGSKFYFVGPLSKTLCWCDLEKISQVNLLSLHNVSLPDPAVVEKRAWDPERCGRLLKLHGPYQVSYIGTAQDWAGSVQSNFVINEAADDFFYYEITVDSTGDSAEIALGIAWKSLDVHEELPGWSPISWALHGDNGDFYVHDNPALSYCLRFSTGDTIGMGILKKSGEIFVTMNGQFLGVGCKCKPVDLGTPLYATVGLRTPGSTITANFGQHPFKFDFIVDSIKWNSVPIIGKVPDWRGAAVPGKNEFIWCHPSGGLVKMDIATQSTHFLKVKNLQFHSANRSIIPPVSCIDRTVWIFNTPVSKNTDSTLYPMLELWEINLDAADQELIAVRHQIPTIDFSRPLPKTLPPIFKPHVKDGKIYFFFSPDEASFYVDTKTMTVHELAIQCHSPGQLKFIDVAGHIICHTAEFEYPWKSVVFSALEGNDWTAMRLSGPPLRSRTYPACASWKNMLLMYGGFNDDFPCVDFDLVTFSEGFESQNGVGFLQTSSGEQYCDVKLEFPDGETIQAHRAVLFARSAKFREILASSSSQPLRIPVKYDAFKHVIDYLYTDTVSLSLTADFARQLSDVFDEWLPEHALRACEYMALNRVMTPSTIGSDFGRLLEDKDLCDITLKIEGKYLRAHRAILVARSAYFRAMLLGNLRESSQAEIEIDGTSYDGFKIILDYIYTLKADAGDFAEIVVDVIIAAAKFGVEPLVRMLEAVIAHNIDSENASSLLELAETHGFPWLKQSCQKFLDK